jgi:hypothetical protein
MQPLCVLVVVLLLLTLIRTERKWRERAAGGHRLVVGGGGTSYDARPFACEDGPSSCAARSADAPSPWAACGSGRVRMGPPSGRAGAAAGAAWQTQRRQLCLWRDAVVSTMLRERPAHARIKHFFNSQKHCPPACWKKKKNPKKRHKIHTDFFPTPALSGLRSREARGLVSQRGATEAGEGGGGASHGRGGETVHDVRGGVAVTCWCARRTNVRRRVRSGAG